MTIAGRRILKLLDEECQNSGSEFWERDRTFLGDHRMVIKRAV